MYLIQYELKALIPVHNEPIRFELRFFFVVRSFGFVLSKLEVRPKIIRYLNTYLRLAVTLVFRCDSFFFIAD